MTRLRDRFPGLVVGALGAAAIWGARSFETPPGQAYGPAMFPTIMGIGLIVCAVMIALRPVPPPFEEPDAPGGKWAALAYALTPVIVLLLFLLVGWPLLCAPLVAGLAWLAGARPLPAVVTGLGMAAFTWVVFAMVLRVPLPRGPLPFLPY